MDAFNTLKTEIRKFIIKNFPSANKQNIFTDESLLLEDGIIDSLGILDLVNFLEKEFLITIADDDLTPDNFQTINNIAGFVTTKNNR